MAEKAKKSTKAKKPTTKKTTKSTKVVKSPTTIKSTVTGKKEEFKPAAGKIICIVAIVASLLVIMVAVMINSFGGNNLFVSDGTKYVLNVEAEEDNDENIVATHVIYYYKDDEITGVKTYYEFATANDAKSAYSSLQELMDDEEDKNTYELSGKYVIIVSPEEDYADMTASDVKSYIELYEKLQNGEISTDEEETVEETEEETEE